MTEKAPTQRIRVECARCFRRLGRLSWVPSMATWDEVDIVRWLAESPRAHAPIGSRLRVALGKPGMARLDGDCKCGAKPRLRLSKVSAAITGDVLVLR